MISMLKKKGSILIETTVSLFILLVCFQITLKIFSDMYKSIGIRNSTLLLRESMNSVCSEIKYNIKFEEINKVLGNSDYKLNYDKYFNNKISEMGLLDIAIYDGGENYIGIEKVENDDIKMKIKITGKYKGVAMEQVIDKAPWMDEV